MTPAQVPPPDRITILEAVMPDLLRVRTDPEDDAVGAALIVAESAGVIAGLPVAKEIFGRLGVRTRMLLAEGAAIAPGRSVAEVGGAIAAIEAAAPVAIAWLQRLSAVASGAEDPEPGNALDAYAAGLSASDPAREGTPSFRLEGNPREG